MNLIELYKEHINPDPTGSEIHEFLKRFDLHKCFVRNPDEAIYRVELQAIHEKQQSAFRWLMCNTKPPKRKVENMSISIPYNINLIFVPCVN